jgi:hypothetical protein
VNNDRKNRRTAVAIFAVALTVAVIAAFITTFEGVSTRQASNEAQPGTTGLAYSPTSLPMRSPNNSQRSPLNFLS